MSEEKSVCQWTKKELLALPVRHWDKDSVYDTVLFLSTGRKHDSGWAAMAIIGVNKGIPIEIASPFSDDIEWILPGAVTFGDCSLYRMGQLRMDCATRSGAMQAWRRGFRFKVGSALSSVSIEMVTSTGESAV